MRTCPFKVCACLLYTSKIILQEDSQTLQEVVVVGYGGVQKAKTMTASAATVKMSELATLPVASMSEGLGGRVTGVVTQQAVSYTHL